MPTAEPLRVVIAGGGVGGVECALALADLAGERIAATLVDPHDGYVDRAWAAADAFRDADRPPVPFDDLLAGTSIGCRRDTIGSVDVAGHAVVLASGERLGYDALVVAVGAELAAVPPGAIALDPGDLAPLRTLAHDVAAGRAGRIAIVVPPGRHWTLPAYELALLLAARGAAEPLVVAPEPLPLSIFGAGAHDALRAELDAAGVRLLGGTAAEIRPGSPPRLVLHPGRVPMPVDRIVALPALRPRQIDGLDVGDGGFLPTGRDGRVNGTPDVYAVGDATDEPVKLGSLAAEQAEVVAQALAHRAGAPPTPRPPAHGPRGLLLTPGRPRALPVLPEATAGEGAGVGAVLTPERLPATKVVAPRLSARLEALIAGR